MDHAPAAHIDANVAEAEEEEKVPGLHSRARYRPTLVIERI